MLEAQESAREAGPPEFSHLKLITLEELHEIRRHWLYEKHEFDDRLPAIYEQVTGTPFPCRKDEGNSLQADDWALLRTLCGEDPAFFELQVGLLGVERKYRAMSWRAGIFDVLEERLRTGLYGSEEAAVAVLGARHEQKKKLLELTVLPEE